MLAMLVSSCGSSAQPAPAATIATGSLPTDWQRLDVPPVSLALPSEWFVTDVAAIDPGNAVTEMANQNPQLKSVLEQGRAALASGQVQLIAYDLDPERVGETSFPANLRLGRQSFSEPPDLEKVSDINEQDLRKTPGFSEVQRARVTIGNLPATRLTSTLQITDAAGQPLALSSEQYLFTSGNDVLLLSFTVPQSRQQNYRAIFDQILSTVRVDS
jgi:hypothetical protein